MGKALLLACALLLSAVLPLGALAQECGVEAIGLDVNGSTISFSVKNTGSAREMISQLIHVNGNALPGVTSPLEPGEKHNLSREYNFSLDTERYDIKAYAKADCGSTHSITVVYWSFKDYACFNPQGFDGQEKCDYATGRYIKCAANKWVSTTQSDYCNRCQYHCGDRMCNCQESHSSCPSDCPASCTQGFTGSYACSGDVRQRQYVYANCTTTWKSDEYCFNGCSEGVCMGQDTARCGVQITSFDYVNQFSSGAGAIATVKSRNTGESTTRVNTSLWVDGVLKDLKYQNVNSGSEFSATLYYDAAPGQHTMVVRSKAGCGSEDSRQSILTSLPSGQTSAVSPAEQPVKPSPPVQKATLVSFYPSFIDTTLHSGRIIGISMASSKPQNFNIRVSGVLQEWLQYNSNAVVEDEKMSYVYITPQETGNYTISISVVPESENLTFGAEIPLFVAEYGSPATAGKGAMSEAAMLFRNILKYLWDRPLLLAGALALLVIIVLLIGHRKLRRERWPL